MNGRKTLFWILAIFLFFTATPTSTYADLKDVDPYDAIFNKNLDNQFGAEKPLFAQYSPLNYRLDYASGNQSGTSGSSGTFLLINTILSFCMVGMALAAKLTIDLMTWAFSYTEITALTNNIDAIVTQLMDKLFFTEFFVIGIFALGVSLLFAFNRREDVGGKLLKVIVNLIIAFTLINGMGTIIKSLNQLSQWGSDAVFIAFGSVANTNVQNFDGDDKGKNAFLNVSSKFFEYNVHIPWQLSQFGTYAPSSKDNLSENEQQVKSESQKILSEKVKTDELSPDKFMSRKSGDDANGDTQGEGDQSISTSSFGTPFRIFVIWLTFTVGTLYGCLLLAIAGTAIICQFLMFLLAIIAPLVFVLVLIPEWGDQMLIRWLQGLLASAVYKIIASLLLVLILFLQSNIYDASGSWAYAMFAQVVLVFAIFLFRKNLLEYIPLPGVAAFQYTENSLFDKGKSIVDKTLDSVVDRARSAAVVGGVPTGVSAGNRTISTSSRASVTTNDEQEQTRRGFFASLGNTVESKSDNKEDQSDESNKKSSSTSKRRQTNLENTGGLAALFGGNKEGTDTRKGSRGAVTSKEGFVHIGEVKDAIDKLVETKHDKAAAKLRTGLQDGDKSGDQFHTGGSMRDSKPVDVRVVDMKPMPKSGEQIAKDSEIQQQKQLSRKSLEDTMSKMDTIEVQKRTVTPVVKEEKVESKQPTKTRKIPKLPFPETGDQKGKKVKNKGDAKSLENLDPIQMLEQQALGPDGQTQDKTDGKPTIGKEEKPKKKKGLLGKMVDKLKK